MRNCGIAELGAWEFSGQSGGKYTANSAQKIFKQSPRLGGMEEDVGFKSLRHSGVYPATAG